MATGDDNFAGLYQELRDVLILDLDNTDTSPIRGYYLRMLDYNVPHGKQYRGKLVSQALSHIKPEHSAADLRSASIIGWCIEFMQAGFLIADDVMDAGVVRRGSPCWYKVPEVGLIAVNDSFFILSGIYRVLSHFFSKQSCYPQLVDLFHSVEYHTVVGQGLDTAASASPDRCTDFTMEQYLAIARWKTSFYTFYLPVAAALILAGVEEPSLFQTAKHILSHIGIYFQVQDDYLDVYGDPATKGKVGTDIQEKKCSWLVVTACSAASPDQLTQLASCYGSSDNDNVATVKKIFAELDLQSRFEKFESDSVAELSRLCEGLTDPRLPPKLFMSIAEMLYRRKK